MNILFKTLKENLNNADAIVSVTFHDSPHPNKIQKIENGYLVSYLGLDSSLPRQTLPKVYTLNGAFYLTHLNILKTMHTFIPPRTLPFIMPPEHSINIDSEIDLIIAEYYLKKNMNNAL
jgi:CMP-N-acetylneuraminic acid synthetase